MKSKDVQIPVEVKRAFMECARNLLGNGYVDEYYETTIVPDLQWAYRVGYAAGLKARKPAKRKR